MADNKINVGGRLHSIATGNVLAGANEIFDDEKNKKQNDINTETYSLVNNINERLNSLSPDQQSALDVATKATNNETKLGYYVCGTEGNLAAKVISDATGYVLSKGGSMKVKMTNANTADNATLNINSTGAKPLYYEGERASANNTWEAGETVEVYYDGANFYANNVAGGSGSGDGAFDVSVKYPTSGVEGGNTYTIEGALAVLNTNLSSNKKKGGMSIKFIQSSDNKYVQYRYMGTATTGSPNPFLNTANWQGVDDKPTHESNNFVKSGGTFTSIASASEKAKSMFNDIASGAVGLDNIIPTMVTGIMIDAETGKIVGGQSSAKRIYYFEASDFMFVSIRLTHHANFTSIFAECDTIPNVGIEVDIKQQFTSVASYLYEWNPTKKYVVVYASEVITAYFRGSTPLSIKDVKDVSEEVKETIDGRNVDLGDFTEFPCDYNFSGGGKTYESFQKYATIPVKANTVISITYGDITVPSICCCLINKQQALKANGHYLQYGDSVSSAGLSVEGDNTIQKIKANTTLVFTPEVDCWLYLTQGENDEWWPESITIKKAKTITEKIVETNKRIDKIHEELDALPAKTTISSVLSFYPNPNCDPVVHSGYTFSEDKYIFKNMSINGYSSIAAYLYYYGSLQAKKYRAAAKFKIEAETEGSYQVFVSRHGIQTSAVEGLKFNQEYICDLGTYDDDGSKHESLRLIFGNFSYAGSATNTIPVTVKIYGAYIIDNSAYKLVDGYQYVLDYSKNYTDVFTNSVISAHSATSDRSSESNHSVDADMAIEATKLRTTLYNKKYVVLGDSLVTYSSGFFSKPFGYLGLIGKTPGIGGVRVNNWGTDRKNGFCTIENLALLPKNMKVLVFWGGVNDYNLYAFSPVGEDGINNERFGNMTDKPLGVADMFNYRVTLENMDVLDTPGRTQTFIQAYKTLLRNISILFPHTLLVCVTQYRAYKYQWSQGKDSLTFRKAYPRVIGAEKDCAAEYGVPVCDLFTKAGVNDSNCFSLLYDDGGSLIHPNSVLAERCVNLMAHTVQENMFLTEPEYNWSYNLSANDKDVRELREYLVDLRSEDEYNVMTLEEAIQGFISYTTEKSITLKNNMYLVFYNNQYGNSVGYFLIDYENPSNVDSWEQWTNDIIYDMRTDENPQTQQPFGVLTLNQAIAAFQAKATLERWEYSNIMYMYFYTDENNNWSMYRLTTPSAPSSTSSWTLVKNSQS